MLYMYESTLAHGHVQRVHESNYPGSYTNHVKLWHCMMHTVMNVVTHNVLIVGVRVLRQVPTVHVYVRGGASFVSYNGTNKARHLQ